MSGIRPFYVGGDISALSKLEELGAVYRDNGNTGAAIEIMSNHGFNCFRLRLFVAPNGGNVVVNDLPYTIALAKRVKAVGATLILDFHYSDTWADPGHQTKPEAWAELDFDGLVATVEQYTRDCTRAFRDAGVSPDIVQIGNEITGGFLWDEGKLYGVGDPDEQWRRFTDLLKAGVRGATDGSSDSPRIMLHIDKGANAFATSWFFNRIERHDVPYDMIGLSYYPWWHGAMDDVRKTMRDTAREFNKEIMIVETAYPYRPHRLSRGENGDSNMAWDATPDGQRAFLDELIKVVRTEGGALGVGVMWWYPESVLTDGIHIWNGGSTALFDDDGNALPALSRLSVGRPPTQTAR
ncbi:MAG: glycosyl hydrolase 53 family protein [Candidatus Poribacteria bacterium]|nr:glycosyl hydrolase 53 family protein [Candidatus Poribacteria bacterium]